MAAMKREESGSSLFAVDMTETRRKTSAVLQPASVATLILIFATDGVRGCIYIYVPFCILLPNEGMSYCFVTWTKYYPCIM